jgi:hypothetical protein
MSEARDLGSALSALRRFAQPRAGDDEACDLCGAALAPAHEHLVDPAAHRLRCACTACALLFDGGATWKRVRHRVQRLDELRLDEACWRALGIPVRVAFFTPSSHAGRIVAGYPGPGGAVEMPLQSRAWDELVTANPQLAALLPDVEALLVDRRPGRERAYRVSIDECYRLVGLMRRHWRGFGGGEEAWRAIAQFFGELDGGAACPS